MTTWRQLIAEAASTGRLDTIDARRIAERASGWDGTELAAHLDESPTERAVAHFDAMVDRRAAGEPLQYVVGGWGFRTLDLYVDRRVLIPRPETEAVVQAAIDAVGGGRRDHRITAVDLGTGSGAIALSLAVELGAEVWATDSSADALAVARANVAGCGATTVRLCEGDWYGALPAELRGRVDLVVSNPPYVATDDELPSVVRDWEPIAALVAGPTGFEDIERIVGDAPEWLARPGVLVVELAPHQAGAATQLARDTGFDDVAVHPDLAGRLRALVARIA